MIRPLALLSSLVLLSPAQARPEPERPRAAWYIEAPEEDEDEGDSTPGWLDDGDERLHRLSLGAGGYSLWRSGRTASLPASPALLFELRGFRPLSTRFSFEWSHALTVQDFSTIRKVYDWYFGRSENRTTRLLLMWPGLILGPLAGSNLSSGPGLLFFSADLPPRLYADWGMQVAAFIRPSEDDLPFDVGLQSFAGLGVEVSEALGLGLRGAFGVPLFHAFDDAWRPKAVTLAMTVNLAY